MLGVVGPSGDERSMMGLFLLEYFHAGMPVGLKQYIGKGGLENGLILKPSSNSLWSSVSTVLGTVSGRVAITLNTVQRTATSVWVKWRWWCLAEAAGCRVVDEVLPEHINGGVQA